MSRKGLNLLKTLNAYMTETNGYDRLMKSVELVDGGAGKCKAKL